MAWKWACPRSWVGPTTVSRPVGGASGAPTGRPGPTPFSPMISPSCDWTARSTSLGRFPPSGSRPACLLQVGHHQGRDRPSHSRYTTSRIQTGLLLPGTSPWGLRPALLAPGRPPSGKKSSFSLQVHHLGDPDWPPSSRYTTLRIKTSLLASGRPPSG